MAGSTPEALLAESRARSEEFFTNPDSYSRFSLTSDAKMILDCIEPRDRLNAEPGDYKVVIQGPGGAIGEGNDHAMAVNAYDGTEITTAEGMHQNAVYRPFLVLDAHYSCAYDAGQAAVAGEMARSSEFTLDTVIELARHFNEEDTVRRTLPKIAVAAARQEEVILTGPQQDLVTHASNIYPHHHNVDEVDGPPLARTYVFNFHPHLGKDRNAKPEDREEARKIQAYCDSIGANVLYLCGNTPRLNSELRGLRLTAMLARTAATRTVISTDKDMTFLEAYPANGEPGIDIIQRNY